MQELQWLTEKPARAHTGRPFAAAWPIHTQLHCRPAPRRRALAETGNMEGALQGLLRAKEDVAADGTDARAWLALARGLTAVGEHGAAYAVGAGHWRPRPAAPAAPAARTAQPRLLRTHAGGHPRPAARAARVAPRAAAGAGGHGQPRSPRCWRRPQGSGARTARARARCRVLGTLPGPPARARAGPERPARGPRGAQHGAAGAAQPHCIPARRVHLRRSHLALLLLLCLPLLCCGRCVQCVGTPALWWRGSALGLRPQSGKPVFARTGAARAPPCRRRGRQL